MRYCPLLAVILLLGDSPFLAAQQSGREGPRVVFNDDAQMLIQELREAVAEGRTLLTTLDSSSETLVKVLDNLSEIDKVELRRLLREEGILVRLRESEVELEPSP